MLYFFILKMKGKLPYTLSSSIFLPYGYGGVQKRGWKDIKDIRGF
jgi:hypothetical protein